MLLEQRNNRAIRTKHIAKTCGHKLTSVFLRSGVVSQFVVQRLDVNLTNTLRAAHDISGIDSLVGGNHHKLSGTILHCQVGNDLRTIYIIGDALRWVVFHHGDVLVSSGMEHILRSILLEQIFHVFLLTDATYNNLCLDVRPILVHHQADVVLWSLGLIHQDQFRWLIGSYLAHHLTANATRRACHHDAVACQLLAHRLHINLNLITRQQVLNADFLYLRNGGISPLLLSLRNQNLNTCIN